MLYPINVQIPFAALYTASKAGKTGLTVTVSVKRVASDGTVNAVTTGSATEGEKGWYFYLLSSGSTGSAGLYICTFSTTDTTVDLQNVPALEIVGAAWVATAAAPSTDILATPANKLTTDSTGATTPIAAQALSQHSGTAQGGASNSLTLAAGASAVDNFYRGQEVVLIDHTGAGQSRIITGYVGSTKVATVGRAWATTPDNTTGYTLFALALAKVNDNLEVTVGTVNDKTGYALTSGEHTAIASDAQTGLTSQGYTTGRAPYLDELSAVNVPADVDTLLTRADVATSTRASATDYTTARAAKLDNLDATVSSRSTYAGGPVASVTGNVGGNVGGSVGSVATDVGITQAGADKVWATTTRALTDKLNFVLSSAGVQSVWDALTTALTTSGSVGKRIADNLDTTVSSRNAVPPDNADIATILTRTDVATSTRLAASAYTAPLDAEGTANAVWDEPQAEHVTAGTTGASLNSAGVEADPWATVLPGSYAPGTAGARFAFLGPDQIVITAPVVYGGQVTIRAGDSYGGAHGNLAAEVREPTNGWPDFTGATALRFKVGTPTVNYYAGAFTLSGTAPNRIASAPLSLAATAALYHGGVPATVQYVAEWGSPVTDRYSLMAGPWTTLPAVADGV